MSSVLDKTVFDISSLLPSEATLTAFKEPSIPKQKPDRLLEDLKALRELFTPRKAWIKGAWQSGNSYCMEGGIAVASGFAKRHDPRDVSGELGSNSRAGKLYRAITANLPSKFHGGGIPDWNDHHATRAKVLNVIDQAITTRLEKLTLKQAKAK